MLRRARAWLRTSLLIAVSGTVGQCRDGAQERTVGVRQSCKSSRKIDSSDDEIALASVAI